MNDATSGTSRRAFLGRAAGAAAVVAGAGVGAGAIAQSAAAADKRTYTAGHFALELDGVDVGAFVGLDGGDEGNVVLDSPVGSDNIQRKRVANIKYVPELQIGSGMGKPLYDWITTSFAKGYQRKNGAILTADFNYRETSRGSMSNAFISSVTMPALDSTLKVPPPVYVAMELTADQVVSTGGSGNVIQAAKQKAWLCSNFVFEIGGVDTSRVATVDSFTWKCTVAEDGTFVLDVSDIGVTFPRSRLSSWQQWYDSLVTSGADDERDGALTLIGAHNGAVITIGLYNLGLYRLTPAIGAASRVKAEMYCEQASWDVKTSK